jgi:hypothetical protein
MLNFSSPVSTQTALEIFFEIFSRKFQNFSEELLSEFQKNPNLSMLFHATTIKACSFKISTRLASTQTDIAKCWTFSQENFRKFQKIFLTIFQVNFKKNSEELFSKFQNNPNPSRGKWG